MEIAWLAWGDEAFDRSREEGKPVLLSISARWCHACHRMDDETWDDPGIAALVRRLTVPVRVDADARPDIYSRYHMGGLPTTAVLDASGQFVRGATFLSPGEAQRFLDVALGDWKSGRRPAPRPAASPSAPESLVATVVARLLRRADPVNGGFGVAPKLPETEALTLLLRQWRHSRDDALRGIVRASLDAIVTHLGDARDGGFFRYAAAPDWAGAHTEKLALDQAQICRLLLEAGPGLGEPRYVDAALAALAHARRRLADGDGRILASVAADPEYYAALEHADADMPAVDRRRFADAGAAIYSAALLARAMTGEDLGFRLEPRDHAPSGAIPHRLDEPGPVHGLLRDQALALAAAVDHYRLTGDPAMLEWGERIARFAMASLWDESASAFRSEPEPTAGAVVLPPMVPLLGNGEMALALADVAAHTGRGEFADRAARAIAALAGRAAVAPSGAALAVAAQRLGDPPARADLDGDPADPRARALAAAAVSALGPTTVVRWNGAGQPVLRLCAGDRCLPPIGRPLELLHALIEVDLAPHGILAHWQRSGPEQRGA